MLHGVSSTLTHTQMKICGNIWRSASVQALMAVVCPMSIPALTIFLLGRLPVIHLFEPVGGVRTAAKPLLEPIFDADFDSNANLPR